MKKADIIDRFLKHQQTQKLSKDVKKPTKKPSKKLTKKHTKKHTTKDKDSPALESAKEYQCEVLHLINSMNLYTPYFFYSYAVLQHRKGQWVVREPEFTVVLQATTSRDEVLNNLDKLVKDFYK